VLKTNAIVRPLLTWFGRSARDLPWRRTRDPYAIWISEVMLQQTQVNTVIPYWERWMQALPTIRHLARANPDRILKLWEGLGYYTRARNLQRAANIIVERHGGRFPEQFSDVLALPGIGRYTAGAICSVAFNQPAPVLDGNVVRVLTRVFGIGGNARSREVHARLWRLAEMLVARAAPVRSHQAARSCAALNQALMELGATVCAPRRPACAICPLRRYCVARRQGRTAQLPNLGPRQRPTARQFVALVLEHNRRFLVSQRPDGVVNACLWEFPNAEIGGTRGDSVRTAKTLVPFPIVEPKLLCRIKHSITRFRLTLDVWRATLTGRRAPPMNSGRWHDLAAMSRLPFPSAHRRIVKMLAAIPSGNRPSQNSHGTRTQR
jgi:A/G-specific adenine glycosylase